MVIYNEKVNKYQVILLQQEYLLQNFFIIKKYWIYFWIMEKGESYNENNNKVLLILLKKDSFGKIKQNILNIQKNLFIVIGIIQDIKEFYFERVLWLYNIIKFFFYLINLKDEKIWVSYKLLLKKYLKGNYFEMNNSLIIYIFNIVKVIM